MSRFHYLCLLGGPDELDIGDAVRQVHALTSISRICARHVEVDWRRHALTS